LKKNDEIENDYDLLKNEPLSYDGQEIDNGNKILNIECIDKTCLNNQIIWGE